MEIQDYPIRVSGLIDFKIALLPKIGKRYRRHSSAIALELCEIGKDAVGNLCTSDKKTARGDCPCGYL
ncbi:hypothetical protein [Paenibacillus tianjinensis]|uniref:Uncharacterized protein n=1 Tax=Paenibacillus tianjinensis TaxID=2810347 RepID=A0ABX7LAJ4_9BACL|nr:hypothetical protein [Paenibacillus tianjinensis]QSF45173.1 hypothetical protein JRJ22_00270 [Paenibacillus tianjinensis]